MKKEAPTLVDIAVPIEYICKLLGLPEDIRGVYHSQKTNTLFIRVAREEVSLPCVSIVAYPNEDNIIELEVNFAEPRLGGMPRRIGGEYRTEHYITSMGTVCKGKIKVAGHKIKACEDQE